MFDAIRHGFVAGLLSLVVLPFEAAAVDALRCGTRLAQVEMRAQQVLAICGEPAFRDTWYNPHPYGGTYVSDTEQWVYNFGPRQLLQVLSFRNGRLIEIESDGYGFSPPTRPVCDPSRVVEGLSKFRLLAFCGEPESRRSINTFVPLERQYGTGSSDRSGRYEAVYREEWVYNFGPRYLLRVLTLENGRVVRVDNDGRGY